MNSREIVARAVEFRGPRRLPIRFESLDLEDTHRVSWKQIGTGNHSQRLTYDEWGCGWARTETKNMGQVKVHPLSSWENLDSYRWPDPDDPGFFEGMEEQFEGSSGKYVLTGIFMLLFERIHSLRGFAEALTDLYAEREKLEYLADRIVEFDIRIIENIASRFPGSIDGFTFTDDWGTEAALIIDPALWRQFFKPRYAKIFQACKAANWHVWMHSCGKVNAIIGDLIDIGVHVLNLQQPRILGIEEIGSRFAGKVCFSSLCDIQQTLPWKGREEIREEAELLLRFWSTKDGGFILSDYGDGEAIGVPLEKKQWMLQAFQELDPWKAGQAGEQQDG